MKNNMAMVRCVMALGGILAALVPSAKAILVYGNNAGSAGIFKMDVNLTTGVGTVIQTFANPSGGNGRGVVVVGNTIYSTVVSDSKIYKTDATTGASLGFIQTAVASMSTIGFDGTNFWTTDYAGSNQGYKISFTTGAVLQTVNFSQATGYMDGMEFFNGKLIVNNTDGGFGGTIRYSIYDLNGTLLTPNFINAPNGTGIAFDGTNFLVSNVFAGGSQQIGYYDGTTGAFIKNITITNGASWLAEDLSVDYSTRVDTGGGGGNAPDGGSTALMVVFSFAVCAFGAKRFGRQALA